MFYTECSSMVQETWVQSLVVSYQRFFNMVRDTSVLNTQQYKVRIKGKLEKSRERSNLCIVAIEKGAHLCIVAIEKGAFWLPSSKGRQLTLVLLF